MRRRISILALSILSTLTLVVGFNPNSYLASAQSSDPPKCTDPAVWFDRARWCGFFKDRLDQEGNDVRVGGIPGNVNTVQELINLVLGDLNSGNAHRRTAAKFFIYTMIDLPAGTTQNPSAAQLNVWVAEWQQRLITYANTSENGTTSRGVNGRIDWFVWEHKPCGTKNTFYQNAHDDIAPYLTTSRNSDCEIPSTLDDFVVIRNKAGTPIYTIRRECMNPMGSIAGLADEPPPDFNLQPGVGAAITDASGAPTAGKIAQVGDTVRFTFTVRNTGTTPSSGPISCSIFGNVRNGYSPPPAPPTYSSTPGYIPPPISNCPPASGFPVGTLISVAIQTVTITSDNQTICRTLRVAPATHNGPARGEESCIYVANKPYLKIYGGDVSVGGGLENAPNTCTGNTNAGVTSWNRQAGGNYAGSGVQYAAFALHAITDFATAQGNNGGAAPPTGFSFANTTANPSAGNFGGNFGSTYCIDDYYARKPAETIALPASVADMAGGTYSAVGATTLAGGAVDLNERMSVYIDGDVFITGNITYPDSWDQSSMPLFQLMVRGNIYVSSAVTRLDGFYAAQQNGSAGGTIYTCATGLTPPTLTAGAFFATCRNKLIVNGSFTANSIEFLRTAGTLSQSESMESSAASRAGEVFNFNPSMWMVRPLEDSKRVDKYDAITSLPPIL